MSFPDTDDHPVHLRSFAEMELLIEVLELAKSHHHFDGALHFITDRDRCWHNIDMALFELNNTLEEGSVIRAGYTDQATWNLFWSSVCRAQATPPGTTTTDERPRMTLTQAYEFGARMLQRALKDARAGKA